MFSDHDNQSNAAAAAPAPEAETAPNSAHPETNSTVESATEQAAPPAATEHAETVSAGQEKPRERRRNGQVRLPMSRRACRGRSKQGRARRGCRNCRRR